MHQHILPALILSLALATAAQAEPYNVEAGPLWNDSDAQRKCPQVCSGLGAKWNGQWHTTRQGEMSVCSCDKEHSGQAGGGQSGGGQSGGGHSSAGRAIEAGPLWNDSDAQNTCPNLCFSYGLKWSGQWKTTVPGQQSVCDCR